MAAQLAKIETAKMPANAIAGVKAMTESNVIPLETDDTRYQKIGLLVLLLIFGVFAVWAGFAPLGSHAMASGQVMVQTKKQVIQHQEGGVIQDIFVQDGDHVEQGQKLMAISPADAQAQQGIVHEQLLSSLGLEARLNAELEGETEIRFPEMLTASKSPRAAEVMVDERQQFKVNKTNSDSERAVLQQRIQQLEEQMLGVDKQVKAQQELAASYTQEIGELKKLFGRQLVSKLQLDETERRYLSVKSDIAELQTNMASMKVQVGETQERLVLQDTQRKKDASEQLSGVREKIADLQNRLDAANDRLQRTNIVAPMAGTVVGLAYHTKGGVVSPGGKIMEIVPKSNNFEIEAKIAVTDIDKVQPGMEADIRFPVFSSSEFLKVMPGHVVDVSADTFTDEMTRQNFYRARVNIEPEGIAELEKHGLELVQGMPAEVAIKTGERTFLQYLFKPLSAMLTHSFNEE